MNPARASPLWYSEKDRAPTVRVYGSAALGPLGGRAVVIGDGTGRRRGGWQGAAHSRYCQR